nr:6376_t:CDS:2 [Entrophospora candida]
MVKKKSGRTLNPADAHRKAMRQKEIKKNKAERRRIRTLVMMHKDTSKLEEEITRYKTLDKEKRLDKNGKVKLKDLEDKFSKIVETKKAHGVSVVNDKPKAIFYNPSGLLPTTDAGNLQPRYAEDSTTDDERSLVHSDESTDDLSDDDENSEEIDDTDEEIDEDIPLPSGSPPKQINETSANDDDELPELPPGPPPSKKRLEISDDEGKGNEGDESEDDDLPSLPPGPPPSMMKKQQKIETKIPHPPSPSSFGFYHSNHHPPFLLPANPFMMYNGPPPGPLNNQIQNMIPPHPPSPNSFPPGTGSNPFGRLPTPIHGQIYSSHTQVSRPPPFSTKFSHYGPPPLQNQQPKQFSQISSSPNSISSSLSPFKSNSTAEPQVRNLQKELTALVPASLLRKKAASNKPKVIRPSVNTAPNIDDGLITEITSSSPSFTIPIKRPSSPSVVANIPLLQNQSSNDKQQQAPPPLPKKSKTRKKVDEYEKFMAEMQDLL